MAVLRRFWWLVLALAALPVMLAAFARPPTGDIPLQDGPLRAEATALLRRAGLPDTPVVVRREGRACGSGTVAGVGPGMRIVLGAPSLAIPRGQALWAVAHEARHALTHDPLLGVVIGWLWATLALGVASEATIAAVRRRGRAGWIAAPLALATVWAAGLPVFNLIQRQRERGADHYAAAMVGGAPGAAFLVREGACLGFEPAPDLFTRLFLLNHPTTAERVAAMRAAPPLGLPPTSSKR